MLKNRLKELRRRDRITQIQLAKAVSLERSSIGKYEGNQNVAPSIDVLQSIADYFNVTTDYLLGRDIKYNQSPSLETAVYENPGNYVTVFNRKEFQGLTQSEIDKLAIYAEGLKAGRINNIHK